MKHWDPITNTHYNISEEWNLQLYCFKILTICIQIYEKLMQRHNIMSHEIKDEPRIEISVYKQTA
jgi:hypothetical protein